MATVKAGRAKVRGKDVGVVPNVVAVSELVALQKAFDKQYGDRMVIRGNEIYQPERLTTLNFALDMAFCGGIPTGRISMFLGRRSAGKTTQALQAIAAAQRTHPHLTHVLIDAEHAYDSVWGERLGVDNSKLLVVRPNSGEEAVDIVEALMRTLEIGLVVLDSIAALVPMAELKNSAEDEMRVGIHAKLVTSLVRKVNSALSSESKREHVPTLLLLNQYRSAIGKHQTHGEPLSIPGGKALEHFTTCQAIFRNKENTGKDDAGVEVLDFNEHAFRVDKNKINGGIRTGEYTLLRQPGDYGLDTGEIDDAATMLAMAKKYGFYTGGGSRWSLQVGPLDETYGKAAEALEDLYADSREKYWLLRNELMAHHARSLGMPQYHIDHILEMRNPWQYHNADDVSQPEEQAPAPAPAKSRAARPAPFKTAPIIRSAPVAASSPLPRRRR